MRPFAIPLPIAVLGVALLAGCSANPSTTDGRAIVEKQIQDRSNGVIQLLGFEKTNGQEREVMGVNVYAMDFEATIKFNSDCYWGSPINADMFFQTSTANPIYPGMQSAKSGQRATISGRLEFEKTEKGWSGHLASTQVEFSAYSKIIEMNVLKKIATRACQFRVRSKELRGGGGSFEGFSVPDDFRSVELASVSADQIVLEYEDVQAAVDAKGEITFKLFTKGGAHARVIAEGTVDFASTPSKEGTSNGEADSVSLNRASINNDLENLATLARQYRIKPKEMAGGSGSYVGYSIPQYLKSNENAVYETTAIEPNSITFTATSAKGYGTIAFTLDEKGTRTNKKSTGKFASAPEGR
jgi:hypothetical protein